VPVRIFPGHVQDGKIVPDADVPLVEGAAVTVIADSAEESFSPSSEQEAELLDAIEAVDRGEVITAAGLLSRLKT
jgi:hypothetical protein